MSASFELIEKLVCDDGFCKYVLNPDKETVTYWDEFRRNNPDKEEEILQARKLVLLLGDDKEADDPNLNQKIDEIKGRIMSGIDKGQGASGPQHVFLKQSMRIAAVLAVLFLFSFLILELSVGFGDRDRISERKNYFSRTTQYGQKASFYLPDGSYVSLNSGSEIYFFECVESSTRQLMLKGEAFFDIKRNPSKPFIVKTTDLTASVLGTSFNVKAYPEEANSELALVTGSVKVSDPSNDSRLLTPNQMVVYREDNESMHVTSFDLEAITGWKDNVLQFDQVGLKEMLVILERWYGVEISLSDSTKWNKGIYSQKDYKGKYKNKSLETVLEAISFSYGFDYQIKGKKVVIR